MIVSNHGLSLSLRQTVPSDAPILLRAYEDESFIRLYRSNNAKQSEEELIKVLTERQQRSPTQLGYLEWMIVHKKHGAIGVAALGDYSSLHKRAEFLIGLFEPKRRSLGYGTEATLLILDLAFNTYQLNKIYSYVYEYNDFSHHNMIKFGFKSEGKLEKHHYSLREQRFLNLYINALTQDGFRECETIRRYSLRLLGRDVTQVPQVVKLSEENKLPLEMGQRFLEGLRSLANN
jgi:ribosomal-protein-alanine N-acetyltransferase